MSRQHVMQKTNEYLVSLGHSPSDFMPSGYTMITDEKTIKVFFYPLDNYLNFGFIPLDRKYNITEDIKINVDPLKVGLEESFIKYQPHKTNSELMHWIPENELSIESIRTVVDFFFNNISDIFAHCEK